MDKKLTESDEESQSFIKKVYLLIRENWLALTCALIISIITIVVVPIVYSLKEGTTTGNGTNYVWDIAGITVINQSTTLNGKNQSLGLISALDFDLDNNLYLLDKTMNRILKFNLDLKMLTLIFGNSNGTSGNDLNSLNQPNDIYVNDQNKIYIADSFNHRIISFDQSTKTSAIVTGTGIAGSSLNQLNQPMSLTIQPTTTFLFIADYGNNRIVLFDLSSNNLTSYLNSPLGDRSTYVLKPISIKSDYESIVIAQETGFNVIRWIKDSPSWSLIAGSASSELNGTSRTLFNQLCSTTIDMVKNTYVNDCYNQRIQFYQGDMTKGRTIAGVIQASGTNQYIFNFPTAIVLDNENNLFVADSNNYRIQMFQSI